ncbi:MFS transporter [Salinibacterium sp. UTAS2018]|uniref:MFS transporter n=1 Tax=Salinibacterium sp. UTAS2018 TaxID=2508880 RepID=UPI0010095E06|nr:MFS transporter [Salinibacterium sp. UTAS2018]QAV70365.1 MFS transporter [Salinibacterium sp. UTAS2018]
MNVDLRVQLSFFTALFAAGMWMSKVAQPLYFERLDSLLAFGVGYAVMAVVGGLSFAWGALADRIGGLRAVKIGTLIYGVGIAGRLLTDLVPVVIFSAIAGLGASLVLVAIRPWVRSNATDDELPRIVGARNLGNQIGVVTGTAGAAVIFSMIDSRIDGPATALWVAPGLIALALLWLTLMPQTRLNPPRLSTRGVRDAPRISSFRSIGFRLAIIGLISGFYVSLVAPYAPLILTEGGASAAQAAIVLALLSGAQILVSWALSRWGSHSRPFRLFALAEVSAGALAILLGLSFGLGLFWVALVFVLRAALIALAVACEETIQYAVIPAHATGLIFGISQAAFLVGDAVGGALGAPLWLATGPEGLLLTAGCATLLNAVLLPVLLSKLKTPQAPSK